MICSFTCSLQSSCFSGALEAVRTPSFSRSFTLWLCIRLYLPLPFLQGLVTAQTSLALLGFSQLTVELSELYYIRCREVICDLSSQPSPGWALLFIDPGEGDKCGKSHRRFARRLSTVFLADSFQVAKSEFAVHLLFCRRIAWVCSSLT